MMSNRIQLSGQNKYWGSVEEATLFWKDLGIDHVMIKREKDIELIGQDGRINEEDFERLKKLQSKYRVEYHLHPYHIIFGNLRMESPLRRDHPVLRQIFADLDRKIQEYELYPLLTVHMPIYKTAKYDFGVDEEVALKNAIEFFQGIEMKSKLNLETMFDPYRHQGDALLGYKAEHFRKIIGDKDFGVCIDVGHLQMATEPLGNFLQLPYPIYSIHLHSNDGTKDSHMLPTKENIKDLRDVVEAMRRCEGPIVLEVGRHNYNKSDLKACIDYWTNCFYNL